MVVMSVVNKFIGKQIYELSGIDLIKIAGEWQLVKD